ncbi:MAG TPA: PilZ domain-containing protein [Candidatus Methylomirabilis sp.]|nr:PilZ domain-containing protein [Candidatus Methylomirabilis sp.]
MESDRRRGDDIRSPALAITLIEQAQLDGGADVGFAQNLSRGGALLRLKRAAVPDAPVRVTLRLGQERQLSLMGRVVWVRSIPDFPGWEVGVQFDEELSPGLVGYVRAAFRHDPSDRSRGDHP